MSARTILDLCGGTGAWSEPYRAAGYNVKVITLPEHDVTDESTVAYCVSLKPYGILCASPCDCWGLAANCRWKERTKEFVFLHAKILVKNLRIIFESKPNFWVIENPPGKMVQFLGKPKYSFDPYDFGEPYHKRTFLWGNFFPPTDQIFNNHEAKHNYIMNATGRDGMNRKTVRAITPMAFARAFFEANP